MTPSPVRRRPVGCPSDLDLDEILAGDLAGRPEELRLRGHIQQCAPCGERLAARQADPALAPDAARLRPFLLAREAQARTRRRGWMGAAAGIAAAFGGAAAAGLLLWGHAAGPRGVDVGAGERTKGALALTVHVKRAAGADGLLAIEPVSGEGRLRAGEEMRFTVTPARPGFAVVLGLDATPSVTTYVPAAGPAPRPVHVEPPGPVALPGSVIADETLGFERIVAIVCPAERPPETLRRQALAALARANGRPEGVSSLGTGCLESSVLLHKQAP